MKYILLLSAVLMLGCYGSQKAKRQVDRAILQQPATAAEELRRAFPCVVVKSDTVITVAGDTIIMVECPDTSYGIVQFDTTVIYRHDTAIRTVRVPVHLPVMTRYITYTVKDSADGYIILDMQRQLAALKLTDAKHKGSSDKWFWIAMGLLVVIGVGIYLKIKSLL